MAMKKLPQKTAFGFFGSSTKALLPGEANASPKKKQKKKKKRTGTTQLILSIYIVEARDIPGARDGDRLRVKIKIDTQVVNYEFFYRHGQVMQSPELKVAVPPLPISAILTSIASCVMFQLTSFLPDTDVVHVSMDKLGVFRTVLGAASFCVADVDQTARHSVALPIRSSADVPGGLLGVLIRAQAMVCAPCCTARTVFSRSTGATSGRHCSTSLGHCIGRRSDSQLIATASARRRQVASKDLCGKRLKLKPTGRCCRRRWWIGAAGR